MARRISQGRAGTWASSSLRYAMFGVCVLSLCLCALALLMAWHTSAIASRHAGSPRSISTGDTEKAIALLQNVCAVAANHIVWGLRMLAIAVASLVAFLVLPAPLGSEGQPDAASTTRRRTAVRVLVAAGILIAVGLAFLFGIGLTGYWLFSHMGP